jgi:Ni/Co efflux regulator RcnB
MILREEQDMRKTLLTLVASAALAFGVAGQASARDYHGGGHHGGYHHRDHDRHYDRGHHRQHYKHHRHHRHHYRPYYSGYHYSPGPYYAPPVQYYAPPVPYYGGYGYGVGYSQPGFGIYIGR